MSLNSSTHTLPLPIGKRVYFASDFHLGAPTPKKSLERERHVVAWLDSIKHDAAAIFLVGDLFDFWFEYQRVMPKGFSRFFGKLAELSDAGIRLVIFKGNHDMWMKDYFETEFGCEVYREPQVFHINDKIFYVGHGDGLGPGDHGYKRLKKVFESRLAKWLFGNVLHPDWGLFLGQAWASHSWRKHEKTNDVYHFESLEKEFLYQYALEVEARTHHDFYIFGHRHYVFDEALSPRTRYINLGDWIHFFTYATFDGEDVKLRKFER